MNFINKMVEHFLKLNRRMKRWQRAVSILSAIVVFATTYALILPAITLDKDTATAEPGIEVAASENNADESGTVYEAEEAPEEEEEEEEPAEEAPAENEAAPEEEENPDGPEDSSAESGQQEAVEAGTNEQAAVVEEEPQAATGEEASTEETTAAIAATTGKTAEEIQLITEDTQLIYKGADYTVYADFGASAKLPEGVVLNVKEITKDSDPEAYEEYYNKSLEEMQDKYDENKVLSLAKFYDITFLYEGNEIEPSGDVKIRIEYKQAVEVESGTNIDAVHFDENTDEEKAEVLSDNKFDADRTETEVKAVEFESDKFSVYGIVYTVDFTWEVDGKEFDFVLPGGGFVSLEALMEVLGVANSDAQSETEAQVTDVLTTNDIEIAEETHKFVADVEKVEFSDPSLLWIGKAEEETTVGTLKEANGLQVQYSAELTDDKVEEIDGQTVDAGDWALISLQPFKTAETLTVTMKTGEVFTIKVMDAQIITHVIAADGTDYVITVIYDDSAEIPEGSILTARELLPDTDEYREYLEASMDELHVQRIGNISMARFFDIQILKDGEKIEPKAPVQVKIEYANAMELGEDQSLHIVHFAEEDTELISDVSVNKEATEISYKQDSFSVTATIVTGDLQGGNEYVVLVKIGDDYFSVLSDGSLDPIEAGSYDPSTNTINVDYPLAWTYESATNNPNWAPYNLVIESWARGFRPNNLPDGYYMRYIDPNVAYAITEETATNDHLSQSCRLYYNATTHQLYGMDAWPDSNGNYIGVGTNSQRKLCITGLQSADNAAEIYMARISSVPPPPTENNSTHDNHTVNHIDISIEADAKIKWPLAFGDYYNANGVKIYTATASDHIIEMNTNVDITVADMKNALVIASVENPSTGKREPINNAFYIDGYSQNHENSGSTAQIRLEGSFKVANLDPINNADNLEWVRNARRENRIYYTVELIKTVTFTVQYNGEDLYNDQNEKMTFNIPITLSASFDYFDERNECPPLHIGYDPNLDFVQEWYQGRIVGSGYDMSGMDFVLGTGAEGENARVPGLEITKYVQDTEGNFIQLQDQMTCDIAVYQNNQNNGTTPIHDKTITIGTSGSGMIYDYDVEAPAFASEIGYDNTRVATAWIEEYSDTDNIPEEIIAADGTKYVYHHTEVETEYVWRDWSSPSRHDRIIYDDRNDAYASDEEIIGAYVWDHYPDHYEYKGVDHDGTEYNQFLEFYIYNIYEKPAYLKVRKEVTFNGVAPQTDEQKQAMAGTYEFKVYKDEACTEPYMQTVDDGNGGTVQQQLTFTVVVGSDGQAVESTPVEIPEGDYWVKETVPVAHNAEITPVTNPVKVTVSAASNSTPETAAVATIVNNLDTGYLKIKKEVTFNGVAPATDAQKQAMAGTYVFDVFTDEDCQNPYMITEDVDDGNGGTTQQQQQLTVTIVIGNDGAAVESAVYEVPFDDYWIKERLPIGHNPKILPVTNPVKVTVDRDNNTTPAKAAIATITNNLIGVDIDVIKYEEGSNPVKYLKDAEFTLSELNENGSYKTDETGTRLPSVVKTTTDTGKITFESLSPGYYEIEETKVPLGYIRVGTGKLTFQIDQTGAVIYAAQTGSNITFVNVGDPLTYQGQTAEAENATYLISNPPGAELPKAGGPGTILYTLSGLMLIMASAMMYGFRMRRRERRFK